MEFMYYPYESEKKKKYCGKCKCLFVSFLKKVKCAYDCNSLFVLFVVTSVLFMFA